jgi:hypothetical protein
MDRRTSDPGEAAIGGYDTQHRLAGFTGPPLPAVIETGNIELSPGLRGFTSEVRPLIEGSMANIQVAALQNSNDIAEWGHVAPQNRIGSCAVRSEGRYHRFRAIIPEGGFWNTIGLDVDVESEGNF